MALTNIEALEVVIGCVKKVGGDTIGPADTLDDGGITDEGRLKSLRSQIVADPTTGVKKFQHLIEASALEDIATDDTGQDVADVVRDNAIEETVGAVPSS